VRFEALEDALGYIQANGKTTAAYNKDNSVSSVITAIQDLVSGVRTEV
jgi:hypothetical protein